MATIVFVHGTGVRGNCCDLVVNLIERRIKDAGLDQKVKACRWGDKYGVPTDGYLSFPEPDTQFRAVGAADPVNADLIAWQALYDDPLVEVRAVEESGGTAEGNPTAAATLAKTIPKPAKQASMLQKFSVVIVTVAFLCGKITHSLCGFLARPGPVLVR
jgi:hypothetical protein